MSVVYLLGGLLSLYGWLPRRESRLGDTDAVLRRPLPTAPGAGRVGTEGLTPREERAVCTLPKALLPPPPPAPEDEDPPACTAETNGRPAGDTPRDGNDAYRPNAAPPLVLRAVAAASAALDFAAFVEAPAFRFRGPAGGPCALCERRSAPVSSSEPGRGEGDGERDAVRRARGAVRCCCAAEVAGSRAVLRVSGVGLTVGVEALEVLTRVMRSTPMLSGPLDTRPRVAKP